MSSVESFSVFVGSNNLPIMYAIVIQLLKHDVKCPPISVSFCVNVWSGFSDIVNSSSVFSRWLWFASFVNFDLFFVMRLLRRIAFTVLLFRKIRFKSFTCVTSLAVHARFCFAHIFLLQKDDKK